MFLFVPKAGTLFGAEHRTSVSERMREVIVNSTKAGRTPESKEDGVKGKRLCQVVAKRASLE